MYRIYTCAGTSQSKASPVYGLLMPSKPNMKRRSGQPPGAPLSWHICKRRINGQGLTPVFDLVRFFGLTLNLFCKKRHRSHTQTHDNNNTTPYTPRTP